jgi:serine/threonine protein kinase
MSGVAAVKLAYCTPAVTARDISELYDIDDKALKGTGAFSRVVVARHKVTGEQRAVKIMELSHLVGKKMEMVQHEKEILRRVDHPNIIKLYETIQTADKVFFCMELMKGDLFDYIMKHKPVPEGDAAIIMKQLVSAIDFLHDQNVVHRDIKPENILINSPHDVKLADFGLAKIVWAASSTVMNTPCGTSFYIAPEIITGIQHNGAKPLCTTREDVKLVDLWSLGVVLYIMLSGRPPFNGQVKTPEERRQLLLKIDQGVLFPPQYWATISPDAKDLISKLLSRDPSQRYTAKSCLTHPFLANVQVHSPNAAPEAAPAPVAAAPEVAAVPTEVAAAAAAAPAAPAGESPASPAGGDLAAQCQALIDAMRVDGDADGETTSFQTKVHGVAAAPTEAVAMASSGAPRGKPK